MKITILGTLPPIGAVSPYCLHQVIALNKLIDIRFINFKSIYPRVLYKHTLEDDLDGLEYRKQIRNLEILAVINWYNPISWIRAGLFIDGDIFHFHWWTYYLFPIFFTMLVIAKIKQKKIVCTLHNIRGHETNIVDWLLTKIILLFAHTIIVHSEENQQSLIKRYYIPDEKIVIIPHSVFKFYKIKRILQNQARNFLEIPLNKKVVLFFGTIRKYKGLDLLIRAFSIVRQSIPNATLLIAGECWDDWQHYNVLIEQLNLREAVIPVIRYIPTSEVQYYYTAADLLVLPYRNFESQSGPGTIGLTFRKAMIVSKVGSLPLLVKNKSCIVSTQHARDYAKVIITILQNKHLQRELETDARSLSATYTATKSARMTYVLYKSLLGT